MGRRLKVLRRTSIHSIALNILKESGKPMRIKEITKLVLTKKSIKSKTPYNSVSAVLQRSEHVIRTSKGTWALNPKSDLKKIKFCKSSKKISNNN